MLKAEAGETSTSQVSVPDDSLISKSTESTNVESIKQPKEGPRKIQD
jgi:hypothetical protein